MGSICSGRRKRWRRWYRELRLRLRTRREDRVGVWVTRPDRPPLPDGSPAEDKIAAIGIRLRRWVSLHGIAVNVEPDLTHFGGIVPCGIAGYGVTSLVDLGLPVTMDDYDVALKSAFEEVFGATESSPGPHIEPMSSAMAVTKALIVTSERTS